MEDKDLEAIHRRLDELEKLIKTVKGEGIIYKINIERAEFTSPIVEHLDYHFDKLDVKEVSGALNLGNNFGVTVGQAIKKKTAEDDQNEDVIQKDSETERHEERHEKDPENKRKETPSAEEQKAPASEQASKRVSSSSKASPKRQTERDRPLGEGEQGKGKADPTNKRPSVPPSKETNKSKHQNTSHVKSQESRKAAPRSQMTFRNSTDSASPPFKIAFFPRGNK